MKQSEYIKTIVYNDRMINLGLDDYGQTYFIEYVEDGELVEELIGPFNLGYDDYIEWRFGDPTINCPIYDDIYTTSTDRCLSLNRAFCSECRKAYTDTAWAELQKRREELEEYFKEN